MINFSHSTRKATIAWLTPDLGEPEPRVRLAADAAGYGIVTGADAAPCDIVVVDLRGFPEPSPVVSDMIARARARAPSAGVIIAASSAAGRNMRSLLRRHGDVHYVGSDAGPLIAFVRERLRLYTLADEMGERMKSLVADGRTVAFSGFQQRRERASVLVAGKPSPLTLNACNAVNRISAHTSCVFSAGQVMRALDHYNFDCAIFLPTGETDLLIALARALRRHREHRKLSVFIASEDDDLLDRCASKEGFDVILASHLESDLAVRLEIAARRARMATTMRAFLRSPEGCGGGKDGPTSARFFAHHAARTFRQAETAGKPVSLAGLAIIPQLGPGAADSASVAIPDAVRTASRLIRAEDMLVKLTPTTLVMLLRGADESEAARIAERIEGVVGGSIARSSGGTGSVAAASVTRGQGEDLEHAVASLLRLLALRQTPVARNG